MQNQQGSTSLLSAFVLLFLFIISFSAFAQATEDCDDPVVLSGSSSSCEPSQPIDISPKLIAPWAQSGGLVADANDGVMHGLSHDPEVGAVLGEPGVSGGAATYQLPITLPPGRNNMTPSVVLSYSSRTGDGIAGVGWRQTPSFNVARPHWHKMGIVLVQHSKPVISCA